MEKLVAVKDDPRYDLIVLDTPPTANALDFLDAPERLMEALDSATMNWFVQAFEIDRQALAQPPRAVGGDRPARDRQDHRRRLPRGDGRVHHRAERSLRRLQAARGAGRRRRSAAPDVAFVLVTRPSPMSIQEVALSSRAPRRARHAARRVRREPLPLAAAARGRRSAPIDDATRAIAAHGAHARGRRAGRASSAPTRTPSALAALDARHVRALDASARRRRARSSACASSPSDVHDLRLLARARRDARCRGGVCAARARASSAIGCFGSGSGVVSSLLRGLRLPRRFAL